MKFSIKNFFSKRDQIRSFLWIWSHLLKKSLMENFISYAVLLTVYRQKKMFLRFLKSLSLYKKIKTKERKKENTQKIKIKI